MKINDGFVLREVAGEQVIMPAGERISTFDGAVALNEVSAFIFSTIEANPGITFEELVSRITDTYEVDAETAGNDLKNVINDLAGYGIVSE